MSGLESKRMGRVRADTLGELDGRQVKLTDHCQGHLASPFLTSFICQNCKEQNSRTQQSSPSVCHAELLSSLDGGSRGCLWSGFCLPRGGGEAELSGCLTTPHNPPLKDSKLPGFFRNPAGVCFSLAVGRKEDLTCNHL